MDFTLFGLVPMLFGGTPADTPRALLEEIYQPISVGHHEQLESYFSQSLQELVARNLQQNEVGADGELIDPNAPAVVDFNPFLNGTDPDIKDLTVTEPIVNDGNAVALVSFTNAEGPTILSISMLENTQSEWKVDDIASVGGGEKWLYSWLLKYDPYSEQ